jgi:hypothetical protein
MSGIYYRTFFAMGRINIIKPAIQDKPAQFSSITSTGDVNVGAITASAILMDPVNIRSADGLVIGGAGDTFTTSGPANRFTIGSAGNISMSGSLRVNNEVITFLNLPTSDPGIPGRLYNSGGVLKISI